MAKKANASQASATQGPKGFGPRRCCKFYCCYFAIPILIAMLAHIAGKAIMEGGDGWGGVPRTLDEETAMCPVWAMNGLRIDIGMVIKGYQMVNSKLFGANDMLFHQSWAGNYATLFSIYGHGLMGFYAPRHSDSVKIPTMTASPPMISVGHISAPDRDIDDPLYWHSIERFIPRFLFQKLFPTIMNCAMGILREFEFDDKLEENRNVWGPLIKPNTRKRDFLMSYYAGQHLWDGTTTMYPTPENDFSVFLKADTWDDGLEKAIAFDLIGAHRVEQTDMTFGGEALPFKIALNEAHKLKTRPGFGKYGADMYFTDKGYPALILTPAGRQVQRGDQDWQYWKFVWRSSLLGLITLIDHLHLTHYRTSNLMAQISRKSLPPFHPTRRIMSIFSFGAIFINNVAHHLLIGHSSPLHRSTPFQDFEGLSESVPHMIKPVSEYHAPFRSEAGWEKLPQILKNAPYFADGKLLYRAIERVMDNLFQALIENDMAGCSAETNWTIQDRHLRQFYRDTMTAEDMAGYTATEALKEMDCRTSHKSSMDWIWTVTGWHRHVGMVADFYADPDLAGFSWKEGEPYVRPLQATLMGIVAAVTGTPHPKINEDYSHLFADLKGGAQLTKIWHEFQEELRGIHTEIAKRNDNRQIKNYHADPAVVECSVAV